MKMDMKMNIKWKLRLMTLALFMISVIMFLLTWNISRKQHDDGLLINLAGRQRMLTQKMAKELMAFQMDRKKTGKGNAALGANVRNTMKVFDSTLSALKDSGEAPLSLDLTSTKYRKCPGATGQAYTQLEKVEEMWKGISEHYNKTLNSVEDIEKEMNHILTENMPLLKEMNSAVVLLQEQSESRVSWLLTSQFVLLIFGAAFMVFAVITVLSTIKRMNKISAFSKKLGEGDLTAQSDIEGTDELGTIGDELDDMSTELKHLFSGIIGKAETLDASSSELNEISGQVSTGAEDVSGRSNTVAVAAEELSTNMNSVAAATEETSTNVGLVATAAEEMTSTINEIAQNSEKARSISGDAVSQAKNASDRIGELGQAAQEIGRVTEAITEISEQTNLLALNATIEAARAGEAGKGFAVVANEIKELARQTAEATQEIKEKIEGVQNSTDGTVKEIEQISNVINEVNDIVSTIATAVEEQSVTTREIAGNVAQAAQGIQEVTENVAQSSVVTGEIARDIVEVNTAATNMADSSTQVNASAVNLSDMSSQLREQMGLFKVE